MTYSKQDALMGGPGLDGYFYNADVYCVPCARDIISGLPCFKNGGTVDQVMFTDSDCIPQPIFFGESDSEQYCEDCGMYLYGEDDEGE